MEINLEYSEVLKFLNQIEFASVNKYELEDFWDYIKELDFTQDYEVFYPKGIFTEQGIDSFYFFTKNKIIKIVISKSPDIQIWSYEKVYSYKLNYPSRHDLILEITLDNGEKIILDNQIDTNHNRRVTMKNKIDGVFKFLCNM